MRAILFFAVILVVLGAAAAIGNGEPIDWDLEGASAVDNTLTLIDERVARAVAFDALWWPAPDRDDISAHMWTPMILPMMDPLPLQLLAIPLPFQFPPEAWLYEAELNNALTYGGGGNGIGKHSRSGRGRVGSVGSAPAAVHMSVVSDENATAPNGTIKVTIYGDRHCTKKEISLELHHPPSNECRPLKCKMGQCVYATERAVHCLPDHRVSVGLFGNDACTKAPWLLPAKIEGRSGDCLKIYESWGKHYYMRVECP